MLRSTGTRTTTNRQKTFHSMPTESAANVRTQFLETAERKLAYRTVGEGTPLILCNRFRGVLDSWDPAFLDALARGFQVVIFTYGGLGRSTGEPHTDTRGMASDVFALADGLGFGTFVLGGWSLGGMAAQTAFAANPELVSHLVLIGTQPQGKTEHRPEPVFSSHSLH